MEKMNKLVKLVRLILCVTIGWVSALIGSYFWKFDINSMAYGILIAIIILLFRFGYDRLFKD